MTTEIGRIFCPKCGNGGTLRKVAVTVGENGIVLAARRPRVSLRGTKASIFVNYSSFEPILECFIVLHVHLQHLHNIYFM